MILRLMTIGRGVGRMLAIGFQKGCTVRLGVCGVHRAGCTVALHGGLTCDKGLGGSFMCLLYAEGDGNARD